MTDDSFYWTPEWQKMEREADDDLERERYDEFESLDDFIADLTKRLDSASDEALLNFERSLDIDSGSFGPKNELTVEKNSTKGLR